MNANDDHIGKHDKTQIVFFFRNPIFMALRQKRTSSTYIAIMTMQISSRTTHRPQFAGVKDDIHTDAYGNILGQP